MNLFQNYLQTYFGKSLEDVKVMLNTIFLQIVKKKLHTHKVYGAVT